MRNVFANIHIRLWALIVLFFAFVFFILLGGRFWRTPWITPLPGVSLEPKRPVLKTWDVKDDSAFDFLRRAFIEQGKIDMSAYYSPYDDITFESRKLNLEPWSDATFAMSAKYFDRARAILQLARKAATAGDPVVPTYSSPFESIPSLYDCKYVTQAMAISAARKSATGDFDGAYADLNEAVDFADILSRGGGLGARLTEISSETRTLTAMRYIALLNKVPGPVAQKTILHLDSVDKAMESFAEAYRQESRSIPALVGLVFDPKTSPRPMPGIFSWSRDIGPLTGGSRAELQRDFESLFAHFIDDAEKPYDAGRQKKLEDIYSRPGFGVSSLLTLRDPLGYLLAMEFGGLPPPYCTILHRTRLAELRATEAVLAIRQFEQNEGRPPARMEDLVPKYLPAVPIDPFNEKPMRYIVKPDGSWIVYSVGPNQIDEGGLIPSHRLTRSDAPGDLVYPGTEAADAKKKAEDEEARIAKEKATEEARESARKSPAPKPVPSLPK